MQGRNLSSWSVGRWLTPTCYASRMTTLDLNLDDLTAGVYDPRVPYVILPFDRGLVRPDPEDGMRLGDGTL